MNSEHQAIAAALRRIGGGRLLVLGDFMLDRTIYGEASRISPEAPSPVVLVQQSRVELGGAGNVVRNVESLGGQVWCAAVAGDDAAAETLEQKLRGMDGCRAARVIREAGRATTIKTRVAAVQPGRAAGAASYGHQQMLRLDEESRHAISEDSVSQVLQFAREALKEVQGVIVSDYAKGALPPALLQPLIALARQVRVPVLVDPKYPDFSRYQGASVLTPNASEAAAALALPMDNSQMLPGVGWERIAEERLAAWDVNALLVTRGAEGLSLIGPGGVHHFPTRAREVFDVTGAGDTVIAAFALAVCAGASFTEAAQLGNAAAGVAVSRAGAAAVHPFEIERELDARYSSAVSKIRSRGELQEICQTLRAQNKRLVFTNGCFDLLHVGHVHLLREAKQFGDILIVALNSDASVERLKGSSRPIVGEQERAEAIAALESVDYLVLFEEDDPLELLRALRPDVLVKGGDYQESEVVGAELLRSYGGEIRLVPLREGLSTSHLVEAIRSGRSSARTRGGNQ